MSKQRPEPPPQQPAAGEKKPAAPAAAPEAKPKPSKPVKPKVPSPWPWGPFARVAVSLLVAFHLFVVFISPWHLQLASSVVPMIEPGGTPTDAQGRVIPLEQLDPQQYPPQLPVIPIALTKYLHHYANLVYVNHGYNFFSPDPTASHLIKYEIYNIANEKIAEGRFPDRREQWPRLFYHRHMMLVEQSRDPAVAGIGWENAIAEHLIEKHDGDWAKLTMLRHHLLTPQQVKDGMRIDATSTYEELGSLQHRRTRPRPSEQLPAAGGAP
jgi:hypothetical protein